MLRNHCWEVIEQISEIYYIRNIFKHFRYLNDQRCLRNTQYILEMLRIPLQVHYSFWDLAKQASVAFYEVFVLGWVLNSNRK